MNQKTGKSQTGLSKSVAQQRQTAAPLFGQRQSQLLPYQSEVLSLQYAAGNRAVGRLLHPERESTIPAGEGIPPIVRSVLSRGSGWPLDPGIRANMEPRFGEDLGCVRLHIDQQAARSASALNARAYTVGHDIVFGSGEYMPSTESGQRLLAHELAHVVQQRRGGAPPIMRDSALHEQQADLAASRVASGKTSTIVEGNTGVGIARAPETPKDSNPPPVPELGQTPFNFISEGPALENWKESAREVLQNEFKRNFSSFKDANEYFQNHLKTLLRDQAESFADRMRDRVRKSFFRREYRKPSFAYSDDERELLKRGAAPRSDLQLEHLEEVKTKTIVRRGISIEGRPERALDPANVYFTKGGKGGTAPRGTPHAKKWEAFPEKWEQPPSAKIRTEPPPSQRLKALPGEAPAPKVTPNEPTAQTNRIAAARASRTSAELGLHELGFLRLARVLKMIEIMTHALQIIDGIFLMHESLAAAERKLAGGAFILGEQIAAAKRLEEIAKALQTDYYNYSETLYEKNESFWRALGHPVAAGVAASNIKPMYNELRNLSRFIDQESSKIDKALHKVRIHKDVLNKIFESQGTESVIGGLTGGSTALLPMWEKLDDLEPLEGHLMLAADYFRPLGGKIDEDSSFLSGWSAALWHAAHLGGVISQEPATLESQSAPSDVSK